MEALLINCTLKPSPEKSNTEALAEVVAEALRGDGVEVASVRAVDHSIPPGVESEMGEGDEWPSIRSQILDAEILIVATPTWLGRPSSVAQRVLERMDAMIAETDEEERPVAYNRVSQLQRLGRSYPVGAVAFELPNIACVQPCSLGKPRLIQALALTEPSEVDRESLHQLATGAGFGPAVLALFRCFIRVEREQLTAALRAAPILECRFHAEPSSLPARGDGFDSCPRAGAGGGDPCDRHGFRSPPSVAWTPALGQLSTADCHAAAAPPVASAALIPFSPPPARSGAAWR